MARQADRRVYQGLQRGGEDAQRRRRGHPHHEGQRWLGHPRRGRPEQARLHAAAEQEYDFIVQKSRMDKLAVIIRAQSLLAQGLANITWRISANHFSNTLHRA